MVECTTVPPWVEHLLSTTFFLPCEIHTKHRNECNKYCLDCRDQAFCPHCIPSSHKKHRVIQIRRSSYHECVKAVEIQKALDITGVQTFVINSAKVIFLNRRIRNEPQPKNPPANTGKKYSECEICQRNLVDPFCFCSIECKLAWIGKDESGSFILSAMKDEEMKGMPEEVPRTLSSKEKEKEKEKEKGLHEGIHKQVIQSKVSSRPQSTLPDSSNSRKRKGIPRRAPFY